MSVFIYGEYRGGKFRNAIFEAVSAGRKIADALGTELVVGLIGPKFDGAQNQLAKFGADLILSAEGAKYPEYNQEIHAEVLKAMAAKAGAKVILFSATTTGKELAPRLAAKLGVGMAADCSEVLVESGKVFAVRPVFAGKAFVKIEFKKEPAVLSLRPKLFLAVEKAGAGKIEAFDADFAEPKAKITAIEAKEAGTIDLTEADIVVSGGRAVKGAEGFSIIRDLANALGGVVGASRAAVDAGWIDHSFQVGQTGKTVNPQLYVACGISGAIQHLAGMRSSKVIVAINKDPEAPIFKIADYGIVGDIFKVVPRLTEEVKKYRE